MGNTFGNIETMSSILTAYTILQGIILLLVILRLMVLLSAQKRMAVITSTLATVNSIQFTYYVLTRVPQCTHMLLTQHCEVHFIVIACTFVLYSSRECSCGSQIMPSLYDIMTIIVMVSFLLAAFGYYMFADIEQLLSTLRGAMTGKGS